MESAMVLTEEEWDDLATLLYQVLHLMEKRALPRTDDDVRRMALAQRIIDAAKE